MWIRPIGIVGFFLLFQLLQNSFFINFGFHPEFVFLFFYSLIFFEKRNNFLFLIFISFLAGTLRDVYSYEYIGPSIIIFLGIGFAIKELQRFFNTREDEHSLLNFLLFGAVSLFFYFLLSAMILHLSLFDHLVVKDIFFNMVLSLLLFYVFSYGKNMFISQRSKQLKLKL